MVLLTDRVQAYVNHGRWIADCGRQYCANAEMLKGAPVVRQQSMHCSNCHLIQEVDWPSDAAQIDAVLSQRPVPQTRNWAPSGHRQAAVTGCPGGQSVADLIDENQKHGVA